MTHPPPETRRTPSGGGTGSDKSILARSLAYNDTRHEDEATDHLVEPGLAAEQLAALCGGRQLAAEYLADVLAALR